MKGIEESASTDGKSLSVRFANITKDNIGQFRSLNLAIFPVRYNDKFYRDLVKGDTINEDNELIRLAYHNDCLIGAIACRLEDVKTGDIIEDTAKKNDSTFKKLYIMTLGVLAPYRGYGVGNKLLKHIIEFVKTSAVVSQIYLHVQINNESAISFYKKFKFDVVETLKGYYKKIEPADCYILGRTFAASEKCIPVEEKKERVQGAFSVRIQRPVVV